VKRDGRRFVGPGNHLGGRNRDVEYLDWRNQKLAARLFQPIGTGPFPAAIDVHGGAWTEGDRFGNDAINMPLARRGVVVLSIDYSVPPTGVYPSSVQDVNYAVRWLKANAARFHTTPDRVGVLGTSSGGHLAVLAALKPFDPRYTAIPLDEEHDARVRFRGGDVARDLSLHPLPAGGAGRRRAG
jgi:acetyl esterase